MRDAIIIDADGTTVDVSAIRPLLPDFHAFHMASPMEPIIEFTRQAWLIAQQVGLAVLLVSARQEQYRELTWWHFALEGLFPDAQFHREDWDGRPDPEVKRDILRRIRQLGFNVVGAIDDQPRIIAVWESEGIPTIRIPGFPDE